MKVEYSSSSRPWLEHDRIKTVPSAHMVRVSNPQRLQNRDRRAVRYRLLCTGSCMLETLRSAVSKLCNASVNIDILARGLHEIANIFNSKPDLDVNHNQQLEQSILDSVAKRVTEVYESDSDTPLSDYYDRSRKQLHEITHLNHSTDNDRSNQYYRLLVKAQNSRQYQLLKARMGVFNINHYQSNLLLASILKAAVARDFSLSKVILKPNSGDELPNDPRTRAILVEHHTGVMSINALNKALQDLYVTNHSVVGKLSPKIKLPSPNPDEQHQGPNSSREISEYRDKAFKQDNYIFPQTRAKLRNWFRNNAPAPKLNEMRQPLSPSTMSLYEQIAAFSAQVPITAPAVLALCLSDTLVRGVARSGKHATTEHILNRKALANVAVQITPIDEHHVAYRMIKVRNTGDNEQHVGIAASRRALEEINALYEHDHPRRYLGDKRTGERRDINLVKYMGNSLNRLSNTEHLISTIREHFPSLLDYYHDRGATINTKFMQQKGVKKCVPAKKAYDRQDLALETITPGRDPVLYTANAMAQALVKTFSDEQLFQYFMYCGKQTGTGMPAEIKYIVTDCLKDQIEECSRDEQTIKLLEDNVPEIFPRKNVPMAIGQFALVDGQFHEDPDKYDLTQQLPHKDSEYDKRHSGPRQAYYLDMVQDQEMDRVASLKSRRKYPDSEIVNKYVNIIDASKPHGTHPSSNIHTDNRKHTLEAAAVTKHIADKSELTARDSTDHTRPASSSQAQHPSGKRRRTHVP